MGPKQEAGWLRYCLVCQPSFSATSAVMIPQRLRLQAVAITNDMALWTLNSWRESRIPNATSLPARSEPDVGSVSLAVGRVSRVWRASIFLSSLVTVRSHTRRCGTQSTSVLLVRKLRSFSVGAWPAPRLGDQGSSQTGEASRPLTLNGNRTARRSHPGGMGLRKAPPRLRHHG